MRGKQRPAMNRGLPVTRRARHRWLPILSCLLFMTLVHADNASDASDASDVWITGVWAGPALGQPVSKEALKDEPRHVQADGSGLPAGQGNASEGAVLYAQQCASCHGNRGQGGKALELVGDRSLLATEFPDRGIAVFWPNAPTLYEYVYRSMPPDNPAVTAESFDRRSDFHDGTIGFYVLKIKRFRGNPSPFSVT